MDDETRKKVRAITREVRLNERERSEWWNTQAKEQESFEREFRLARKNIIKPVLDDFKSELEGAGYLVVVEENDGGMKPWGERPDRVTLRIEVEYLCSKPEIEFLGYRHNQKVAVSHTVATENTGNTEPAGSYTINQISEDMVKGAVINFLEIMKPNLRPPREG